MRSKMLLCLAVVLLASPLAAQEPDSTQTGPISGWVQNYNNTTPAYGAYVKVCSPYYCQQVGTGYGGSFQITPGFTGNLSLYAYTGQIDPWDPGGQWGSSDDVYTTRDACGNTDSNGNCTGHIITFFLYPRPLQPRLLQPANGQTDVPLTGLTLSWTDGLDATRRQISGYAANTLYDIYGSGCCIPPQLYASNVSCNGSNGVCSYTVPATLSPGASYSWYVKAKYHTPIYDRNAYNTYLTRQSYTSGFTTTGSPTMTYSFRTYYSFYMSAVNCGGDTLNSAPQSIGTCEKFKIEDANGGDLMNGDQIHIRANNGSYWTAVNGGGGAVNANTAYANAWETFRIWKLNNSGQGPIVGGDNIALTCSNGQYVVAEGGGYGGVVNCNRTTAAQWETFGINPWP
jgi:hypothetical protein